MSTFDDLLNGRPVPTQATARAARAFIRSLGADVREQIGKEEASYGRGRAFCVLAIGRGEVLVRFPADAPPDPHKLLRGDGKGQRFVRLRAPTDLSDQVRAMIRLSYNQAT
jgi:hypothetical protein